MKINTSLLKIEIFSKPSDGMVLVGQACKIQIWDLLIGKGGILVYLGYRVIEF